MSDVSCQMSMVILGIDPGTVSIGYALLQTKDGLKLLDAGLIKISSDGRTDRLKELHKELNLLVRRWRPEAVAIEKIFFAKNAKTAIEVSEARGAILLTTLLAGLMVFEYTPLEIKMAVTGDGRADKNQIKKMVGLTLVGTELPGARDDVFDAIAVSLACYFLEDKKRRFKIKS